MLVGLLQWCCFSQLICLSVVLFYLTDTVLSEESKKQNKSDDIHDSILWGACATATLTVAIWVGLWFLDHSILFGDKFCALGLVKFLALVTVFSGINYEGG